MNYYAGGCQWSSMTYLILEDYLFPLLCINKGIISISIMDTTVEEDYICIYLQMHPFEKIHCDYT